MNMTNDGQSGDLWNYLLSTAELVVKGQVALHDERRMLVPKQELIDAICPISSRDIQELLDNQLLVPIEYDNSGVPLFHIANSIEFIRFLEELEHASFPLILQQTIAETYQALLWAFYSDIDYEISEFKEEHGREPSEFELAYMRVINELAVALCMTRIEDDILAGRTDELKSAKERAAKFKRATLKKASFGLAESEVGEIVRRTWKPPLQYFRGREIKAFIDISSIRWPKKELNLLWTGHFDFALCSENGVLCLVIEYQGKGHFGRSVEDMKKTKQRDNIKQSICDKVGIPFIQLDPEYAFIKGHKQLLEQFLGVFRTKRHDYTPVVKLLREQLDMMFSRAESPTQIDHRLINLKHRLDIYEIQRKGDSILALLWELHRIQTPLSSLPTILKNFNC